MEANCATVIPVPWATSARLRPAINRWSFQLVICKRR
jgi:hypothetical protein